MRKRSSFTMRSFARRAPIDVGGRQQTTRIIAASPCPEQKHKIGDLWRPYFADDSKCRGLTGCVRRMRPARIAPVDRVEQIAELRRRDRDGAVRRARPDEPARFETLGVKRQADAVVRQRTLIMSPRRPRKTKRSPACGSRPGPSWICNVKPFMPRRMSVTPPASQTRTPEGTEIMIAALSTSRRPTPSERSRRFSLARRQAPP